MVHLILVAWLALLPVMAPPVAQQGAIPASEDVRLKTEGTSLAGTFLVPASPRPVPVVLIIAGSGPTDRDGNSAMLPGKNNSLKMLAEALAAEGIASFRYDKRAIAGSREPAINEADLRFEHYVDDAASLIDQLKRDSRFSSVTVVGHSEGSLIGMMAAVKTKANGFVSIAGPARRASVALLDQLRAQLGAMPAVMEGVASTVASLEAGKTVETLPAAVASLPPVANLFRASVQPYLISWFRYDPVAEISKLSVPVLIVQGTTDLQVPSPEAAALAKGAPSATVRLVTGMNHVLKKVEGGLMQQVPSYSDPSLPIVPDVPQAVTALVRAVR